jgi:hypothetical protein
MLLNPDPHTSLFLANFYNEIQELVIQLSSQPVHKLVSKTTTPREAFESTVEQFRNIWL